MHRLDVLRKKVNWSAEPYCFIPKRSVSWKGVVGEVRYGGPTNNEWPAWLLDLLTEDEYEIEETPYRYPVKTKITIHRVPVFTADLVPLRTAKGRSRASILWGMSDHYRLVQHSDGVPDHYTGETAMSCVTTTLEVGFNIMKTLVTGEKLPHEPHINSRSVRGIWVPEKSGSNMNIVPFDPLKHKVL